MRRLIIAVRPQLRPITAAEIRRRRLHASTGVREITASIADPSNRPTRRSVQPRYAASPMKYVALAVLLTAGQVQAEPENMLLADLGLHVVGIGYQRTVAPGVAVQLCAESYTPWTQEDRVFEVQGAVLRLRP